MPGIVYCSVYSRCYATTARWANIPGQFLGNGSVNTFPQKRIRMQTEEVFSTCSVQRCSKQGSRSVDSCVRESVKKGLGREAEECPLLKSLTRKRLVKKILAGIVFK
jgi:hypothetical protein